MPSSPNQKMKLLYLMKILLERTDEDHILTIQEILNALAEYDIKAERKSIYSDIELLRKYGLNVEMRREKTFGYYTDSRQFELPELKLLVDAVQSSRFVTHRKSEALIRKLSALASKHQAKQLKRQIFIAGRPKAINEAVYYNIDMIYAAINEKKRIRFKYFDYDLNKKRVYRRDGERYSHTPLALCWNDDKYYLICYSATFSNFTHYRVDRMSDVSICDEKAARYDRGSFNIAEYTKRFFGMYSGELVTATLRFDNSLINTVLDRFGVGTLLRKRGDCFDVVEEISGSKVFLSWMMQFGDKAEIVAPESLRAEMRELLNTVGRKY